ncbi:MAG: tetratricopeptide repeat protein [Verrucomicrobia bacterium]|nr:tetratricopeptide repeat protein [Verrucomicrobiota bacterium]
MSAHFARAQLLMAQSRPADAERELMAALATQPDDPAALALLALSRSEQRKGPEALAAAESAIGLAPDEAYFHYVHAVTLHRLDRDDDARRAVGEALRLNPADEDLFSLLASIELARRNWPAALEAAEQALTLNPEHVNAANLRAMALVRLGRKEEATATVDFALHRAPENGFSHANQGWNCLHRNDPKKAQEHFREALRLEPDLEYARSGMLEALKARNPVYRGMLAYFLWMGALSTRLQWAFILGIFFGGRIIRGVAERQPQLGWVLWPLLGLFYAFVYLSWTAGPMFNLLLRFDRFGRHVLSRDQRIASNWFGAAFFAALGMLVWWFSTGAELGFIATILLAVISICLAATFAHTARNRAILGSVTGALAVLGVALVVVLLREPPDDPNPSELGSSLSNLFMIVFVGFQILANTLRSR